MTYQLRFPAENAGLCLVFDESGLHVGNLKRIGGAWKFKAVGYNSAGQVLPGYGPLTDRHNTVFAVLDEADITRVLS